MNVGPMNSLFCPWREMAKRTGRRNRSLYSLMVFGRKGHPTKDLMVRTPNKGLNGACHKITRFSFRLEVFITNCFLWDYDDEKPRVFFPFTRRWVKVGESGHTIRHYLLFVCFGQSKYMGYRGIHIYTNDLISIEYKSTLRSFSWPFRRSQAH